MLEKETREAYVALICDYAQKEPGYLIVLTDNDQKVLDCNQTFLDLTGEEKKPLGKSLDQYFTSFRRQNTPCDSAMFPSARVSGKTGCSFFSGIMISVPEGTLLMGTEHSPEESHRKEQISSLENTLADLRQGLLAKQKELDEAQERISILLRTDMLTGIANRRHFYETLQRTYAYAARQNLPLSLIMADLDRFKTVNDTYGHQTGDQVLVKFARMLHENCRTEDLAARFGGEEFMVILTHGGTEEAVQFAERLRKRTIAIQVPGINYPITASFGVATLSAEGSMDDLIKRADEAMYRAKHKGRNCVEV